jgi:hypothetical protein
MKEFLRRNRLPIALFAVAAVALPAYAIAATGDRPVQSGVHVSVATDPAALSIGTGQCGGGQFTAKLTNTGQDPVYADADLSAPPQLSLQRQMISTYLPPGYTRDVTIPLTAPLGTASGTYSVQLSTSDSSAKLPVAVTAATPDPSGNLARSATRVSASSTHAGYPVCGAVDGDTDSTHWSTTTGWNDGTAKAWPDWFELDWASAQTIGRVELYTLDSAKYPAARYGLRDWDVQVLSGGQWQTVASVRGNTSGLAGSTFTPVQTTALRITALAGNGADDYARIVELEAFAH